VLGPYIFCLSGYLPKQPLCLLVQLIGGGKEKRGIVGKKGSRKFGKRIYKRRGIKVNNMMGIPSHTGMS